MRIVSLLPSATEIVYQLGLGADLRGVSFECDHPAEARAVPIVSGTALSTDTPVDIDGEVAARLAAGLPIYTLDDNRLRAIDPDVILTQDLCRVCAVPSGDVDAALEQIGCHADVVSLDPSRLDDVIDGIGAVGRATGTEERAAAVMAGLRTRLDAVRQRVAGRDRPRVLVIEWAEPLFNAGHWVPDMIETAGGRPVLAAAGERSRQLTWAEVAAEPVDVTLFSPCGFGLDAAVDQSADLLAHPEATHLGRVYAVDANSHFSRPGPRVVDGVEVLAELLHGDDPDGVAPDRARRLR